MSECKIFILGQGLAGTCLAWRLFERGIPFRIHDRGFGGSSRIAAGLINPITGKNFEPSWLIQEFHPEAVSFYQKLEELLAAKLWYPLPVLRLSSSEKESRKIAAKLESSHIAPWLSDQAFPGVPTGFHTAVELKGGGRVDTELFISLSHKFFSNKGLTTEQSELPADTTILCQGAEGLVENKLGQHRCAKGEILTVRANWPESHIRIGAGGWLVPIGARTFRIGSTYEWNQLDELPTQPGLERILGLANKLGGPDFEVIAHVAGIRPILRRSQPLIGKNKDGNWIFNALGSKGTLYAPKMATMLSDWILDKKEPLEHFRYTGEDAAC
ncbi:NAD(P)/FAD-dependent oxidoreductase [Luteolibacter sp. AS25]|uniref:NAD(P)/FAD-dependent oxidoreductase n=1 Tax=Luteolibacter sp. AS25 TaxID=3135776 RepID=UPI00398B5D3A